MIVLMHIMFIVSLIDSNWHWLLLLEVISIHNFFSDLAFITNIVGAFCKQHDELQAAQAKEIAKILAIDEIETGKGLNQIDTVK